MKRSACLVLASQLAASVASADPYPFEGFFALRASGPPHAGCGFDILHQTHSGEFSGYLLDKRHWDAHREPRFVRYKHGACTFDSATAVDNCVTHTNYITDVSDAQPDRAKITVLDDTSVAMLTLGEGDDPDKLPDAPPFVFERCPFDEAQIVPLLADTAATYSKEALQEMARSRDADLKIEVLQAIQAPGGGADK